MHLRDPRVRTPEAASLPPSPADRATEMADGPGEALPEPAEVARSLVAAVREHRVLALLLAIALGVSVWLRFQTASALWLDEALTVNIARAPLGSIPHLLREDGAPPLYYFLLHGWILLFGQGNLATRSLSGVFGVINLPVAYVAGSRIGSRWWTIDRATGEDRRVRLERGRIVGWGALLLLASSPFAVYYDTEARMYGLVILLGSVAIVIYTSLLRHPSLLGALALAGDTAALLYSHYWSLFAGAVVGAGTILWALKAHDERTRKACRYAIAGLVAGLLAFIPWVPTFAFQLRHTGTPWASPAGLTAVIFTITQFAGGNSDPGRALALIFFFLGVVALAGAPYGRRMVLLDLRSRPGIRALALVVAGTLVLAVVAGRLTGSTFADRYTSVIAFPALLIVAYGLSQLPEQRIRYGVLGAAVALGFAASIPNAFLSRTQGGQVGAAVSAQGHAGDVVAFCPDQLGPAVSRSLQGDFKALTFPRRTSPDLVDWVNYTKTVEAAKPGAFVTDLLHLAGTTHTIWYVWAPNYLGYANKCQAIADALSRARPQHVVVPARASDTPYEIFEGETLDRYPPR